MVHINASKPITMGDGLSPRSLYLSSSTYSTIPHVNHQPQVQIIHNMSYTPLLTSACSGCRDRACVMVVSVAGTSAPRRLFSYFRRRHIPLRAQYRYTSGLPRYRLRLSCMLRRKDQEPRRRGCCTFLQGARKEQPAFLLGGTGCLL